MRVREREQIRMETAKKTVQGELPTQSPIDIVLTHAQIYTSIWEKQKL